MKQLHEVQERLLELLRLNMESPLTIEALRLELQVSSKSVVHHHITQLETKGYLKRNPQNPRDYTLLHEPERQIVYLNKYGLAQCGPDGTIFDGNPIDRIPIASKLLRFPSDEAFIVEARGDSMTPKIKPGDLIIARKQTTASDGDLVVCVNNEATIIKRYRVQHADVKLQSLNDKYHPLSPAEDFRIQGVVRNIIHYD